jgi:hypothetical protein
MRIVSMLLAIALTASPAVAQQSQPIQASIERAAEAAAEQAASQPKPAASARKGVLFWSGLAVGVAGATTSALGLTAFRTEDNSTGNAPAGAYLACVAQKNSSPVYATNQCDGLKAKNLKLLWSGVAIGGLGAAMMIGGSRTSAELSSGAIGIFHRVSF